jgi:hypothetical protein
MRRDMTVDRWESRTYRQTTTFSPFPRPPYIRTVVIYRDPYADAFWWWLLAQNLETRTYWAYHHRRMMDDLRYRELLSHDQQLEARIRELEAKGITRDPTYVPPGMDSDLMYDDGFVEAVYNPTTTIRVTGGSRAGHFMRSCFMVLMVLGALFLIVWIIFVKRWGASE